MFGSAVAYGGSTVVKRKGLNLYEKNVGQFIDHTGIFFDSNTASEKRNHNCAINCIGFTCSSSIIIDRIVH